MWDYESLNNKATDFIRKGLDHESPDSQEVPLWCILGLELLARATLARISPALLADPKDEANILYAFDYPGKKAPISIPAKTVFHRCTVVCEGFTKGDYDKCIEWLNWRNEELHTGALPFAQLTTGSWLADFFRISGILAEQNDSSLGAIVGPDHAESASEMVDSLLNKRKEEAFELVKRAHDKFQALSDEERLEKLKSGEERVKKGQSLRKDGKAIECPSCEGTALILGSLVRSTMPKDKDGEFVQDDVWLPTELGCHACGLTVLEHAHIAALGFGDQYVTKDTLDPSDYYEIEFDLSKYYEEDYPINE